MEAAAELHRAASAGNEAEVRRLLAAGARADVPDADGDLALHRACLCHHAGVVQLLLEAAPATASAPGRFGWTPLHSVVANLQFDGTTAVVRQLLAADPATALAVDRHGFTQLHRAAIIGHSSAMKLLLEAAPAAAAMLDSDQRAPIHFAAAAGDTAAVHLLLEAAPALGFAPDAAGRTPLHMLLHRTDRTLQGIMETARCLVRAAPAVQPTLSLLTRNGLLLSGLCADLVAHLPLTQEQWQSIPAPCPDLARALPAVQDRSAAEAGWLVGRLAEDQRALLQTATLSLGRAQQQGQRSMPAELMQRILALCLLDS